MDFIEDDPADLDFCPFPIRVRPVKKIHQMDTTYVTLPRKVLLTMTLEDFDTFVKDFPRELSPHELRQVKRQRRMISNRESAALSRWRQKELVDELKMENAQLRHENKVLKAKIKSIQ